MNLYNIDFEGRLVFSCIKYNKRLVIALEASPKLIPLGGMGKYLNGKGPTVFYTPPDFIRVLFRTRKPMEELAHRLQVVRPADRIKVIMDFEKDVLEGKKT